MTHTMPSGSAYERPLINSMGGSVSLGISRTEFESGVARQRRRVSGLRSIVNVEYLFTPSEFSTFMSFVQAVGAEWFLYTICVPWHSGSGVHTVRIVGDINYNFSGSGKDGSLTKVSVPMEFSHLENTGYVEPSGSGVNPGSIG